MKRLRVTLTVLLLAATLSASAEGPAKINLNRYTTTDRSYGANAYWLESGDGIVLVDALFLKPDAELLATLLASRDKPIAGIILTHPHVDHFGGLGVMRRHFPGVPIFATQATASEVRTTHEKAYADGWIQAFGTDYEETVVTPDRIVESGAELTLAGMHFTVTSFGAMESSDNTVVYNRELDVVFAGDALVNGAVYYLGEGHSAGAIEGMLRLAETYSKVKVALPGHGDPGDLHLIIEENLRQVRSLRHDVETAADRPGAVTEQGVLKDLVRARLVGTFSERLKGKLSYGLSVDMIARMNLAGLENEVIGERTKK